MAAQFSINQGQTKVDIAEATVSMTTADVRVQIKTGTQPVDVIRSLREIEQHVLGTDAWKAR